MNNIKEYARYLSNKIKASDSHYYARHNNKELYEFQMELLRELSLQQTIGQ